MSNEVALPKEIGDKLREKLLGSMMELIPEEKLQQFIEKEILSFFNPAEKVEVRCSSSSYSSAGSVSYSGEFSPFRVLIWKMLSEHMSKKLEENKAAILERADAEFQASLQKMEDAQEAITIRLAVAAQAVQTREMVNIASSQAVGTMRDALQRLGVPYYDLPTPTQF